VPRIWNKTGIPHTGWNFLRTVVHELTFNMKRQALLCWIADELGNEQLLDSRLSTQDHVDALVSAMIAKLFVQQPEKLSHPTIEIPVKVGWIFVPKDCLKQQNFKTHFLIS
jgi:hypothetical protein